MMPAKLPSGALIRRESWIRPFAGCAPEHGPADEQPLDLAQLMHQEMLAIRQIDLGGLPVDAGLDQIATGIGVGKLQQKIGSPGGILQQIRQLGLIGAEAAEIIGQEVKDTIGVGNRPGSLLGDDMCQVAGIALRAGQRFLPIARGQFDDCEPGRGCQQQRTEPDDRKQPFYITRLARSMMILDPTA